MSSEIPTNNPEKNTGVSDNDRKFVIETLDAEFLAAHKATSYILTTDWLETTEDTETKLARKEFENGEVQLLHIAKVDVDGNRKSVKKPISENDYRDSLDPSMPHVEKRRYEFEFTQNDVDFVAKYDEFANSTLRVLEIDAKSKADEDRQKFDPKTFDYPIVEVTGIKQFYGHRIATLLANELGKVG